jgi:hypothetical protein
MRLIHSDFEGVWQPDIASVWSRVTCLTNSSLPRLIPTFTQNLAGMSDSAVTQQGDGSQQKSLPP